MRILNMFSLNEAAYLLAAGLNDLGIHSDVIFSSRQFKTQGPAWTKQYPQLEGHCFVHQSEDMMDPFTISALGKFANKYDIIITHAPAPVYHHLFKRPHFLWDGGAWRFMKLDKVNPIQQYDREAARRGYYGADHIFASDIDVYYKHMTDRLRENSTTVPLPIDTELYKKTAKADIEGSEGKFVIYFPTRKIHAYKGIIFILKALEMFVREVPDTIILMTMYGKDTKLTEFYCEPITDYIRYLRVVPKPQHVAYINAADVVIDQVWLGVLGGNAWQAMACQTPVVGNVNQAWYEDAYERLPCLTTGNNQPENIYRALMRAYESPRTRMLIGKRGREYVNKYHEYHNVAQRVFDTIEMVIE